MNSNFDLANEAVRLPYTPELASFCEPFTCDDTDLDDFFNNVSLHYDSEMLGKTYAWVLKSDPRNILGMITLANDSIKLKLIAKSALNRLQRGVSNSKRGINFPAVLIGRLGVASQFRGKDYSIGSQIITFVKEWFQSTSNKTGCRFIVVDAYNNERTMHFYQKNGFKLLYKTEQEERSFLELDAATQLDTRFMFLDLKLS